MRFVSTLTLGLLLGLGGAMAATPTAAIAKEKPAKPAEAGKITLSKDLLPIAVKVQDAVKASDFAGAKALLDTATPVATTPDDKYWLAQQQLNIGIQLKDVALQRTGIEAVIASGKITPEEAPKMEFFAGQFALQAKDYDSAISHLTKSVELKYPGSSAQLLLAESYFQKATAQGTNMSPANKAIAAQGVPYIKQAVQIEEATGKPAPYEWYERGFSFAYTLGLPDAGEWALSRLKARPGPDQWRGVLRGYQDLHADLTRGENLDILRLMALSKGMTAPSDYGEYVEAASKSGLLGEVVSAVDAGRSAGVLSGSALAGYYDQAKPNVARDKASMAAAEVDATKSATGALAVSTADAYLGYNEYAKAAQFYQMGLTKGGVDKEEVATRLGIALVHLGKDAEARAAFAQVTTKPARKAIAGFWITYLDIKAAPAAAAPAAS